MIQSPPSCFGRAGHVKRSTEPFMPVNVGAAATRPGLSTLVTVTVRSCEADSRFAPVPLTAVMVTRYTLVLLLLRGRPRGFS